MAESRRCPILAIEGLPGAGKTYLTSQLVERTQADGHYASVYWHAPPENESLDECLLSVGRVIDMQGSSLDAKCRSLVSHLRNSRALLVLDDFHSVQQATYGPLLAAAARLGDPATLVLLSRTYVDAERAWPMVRHFEVRGYAREETSEFLRSQGVALGPEIVATLHEKTDGLPLAILLFTIFIRDFATDPVDLLSGDIAADSRLQQWFDDVISRVTESERRLLRILSVHGGLFNKGLVTGVAKRMNIESSQSAFLGLQSRFLVQQYTPYRWKVHHLIRLYALQQLVDDEQRAILTFFGEHSLGGIIGLRAARYSQDQVQQVVRAINFFQRARDWSRSQELLSSVSRAIKKHGLYGMLIGPAEIQSHEGRQRDTWLDYNLAHCYFITGALKRAFEICERLVTTIPLDQPDKRVAVVRLYAELLASVGRHAVGLQKLQEVLAAGTVRALPHTILAHARSVEVMLQTATGDIESAWANSETLLSHAQERKDKRGTAVALTRRGLIEMQRARFREALPAFKESVRLFGEVGDNRGRAWAMMYASECLFEVGDTINGESMLVDGLIIKADIGETSTDYKNLLTRIQKRPLTTASLERLTQEMGRLSLAMSSSTGGI